MPLYQYKCITCGLESDEYRSIEKRNDNGTCSMCEGKTKKVFAQGKIHVWEPITLEHIATTPMTFDSKNKLRKYCRKNGLESGALL